MLKEIVHQKTVEQKKSGVNPRQDLISFLLSMVEDDKQVLTEKEIIHNSMLVMVGGYDTSSVLITFIIRLLANEPAICAAVLQGMHRYVRARACVCVRERKSFSIENTCSNSDSVFVLFKSEGKEIYIIEYIWLHLQNRKK
jgi:hypothetical protein